MHSRHLAKLSHPTRDLKCEANRRATEVEKQIRSALAQMGEVAPFEALERDLVQRASSRAIQEFRFCGDDTQIAMFRSKRRFP
jgi:hypothetical protein